MTHRGAEVPGAVRIYAHNAKSTNAGARGIPDPQGREGRFAPDTPDPRGWGTDLLGGPPTFVRGGGYNPTSYVIIMAQVFVPES